MRFYCDTSFFFRQLTSSQTRLKAIEQAANLIRDHGFIPITTLTRLEVIQALRFDAWLNQNDKNKGTSLAQVNLSLALFLAEIGSSFQVLPIDWDQAFARAESLTRSTPENGWRTVDVIHVAAALVSGARSFYSFDKDQNILAEREGMACPLINLV